MQTTPRSEWSSHPNYPSQALLLGSHDNFRRVSELLVRESMKAWSVAPQAPPQAPLRQLFDRWKRAMKGHEAYEEGKLYPYLEARFGVDLTSLRADHRELSTAEGKVRDAFDAGDALAFAHALRAHDEILDTHLDEEEDAVIPLLLSLEPGEFRRYYNGQIDDLLRSLDGPA